MPPYSTPACCRLEYVTARPIPKIPNAKNPGTRFKTVAPQLEALYNAEPDTAAVLTCVEIGPIKDTPTRIDTNPPTSVAIIFF